MRRASVVLAGAAVALALAGCGTTASPGPTPAASTSAPVTEPSSTSATPTPVTSSPTPHADPAVVHPGCEELVPLEVMKTNFSATAVRYETPGEADREQALRQLGPVAQATLAAADSQQICYWIVEGGSDGGVHVITAQPQPDDREQLLTALASSVYSEIDVDGATAFGTERDAWVSLRYDIHAFAGPAWVIVSGSGSLDHGRPIAEAAVAATLAANPRLGG